MAAKVGAQIKLTALDRLSGPLRNVSKTLDNVTRAAIKSANRFKLFQKKTEALRKSLNKIGGGFKSVGQTMTAGVTLPIFAAGAGILKTAADFEKSMNKVRALTGATGESFLKMEQLARKLGASTKFSAKEAADAMSFLGMAGFDTNEILQATPALLNLAAASGVDLARAADIASNIMGAFNLDATKTGQVADVLAKVTASANVDMEQLAETMKFAGPIAFQFGATLQETAAAAGLLGNLGIQGSVAGTALKRAFLALSSPAGEAGKILESAGIKVSDAQGNMRRFGDVMTDLGNRLGELPQQTRLQILDKVFGKIGITGAAALQRFARTGELKRFTQSMQNVEGTAQNMANIMNEGATGAVISFQSAMSELSIAIAKSGLLKFFTDVVKDLTEFVRNISKANPIMFRGGVVAGVLAAALGPLLILFGGMVAAIGPLITIFTGLFTIITGLSTPVLAFVGLAALVIANWQKVADFFEKLFTDPIGALKDLLFGTIDLIDKFTQAVVDAVMNPMKTIENFVDFLAEKLGTVLNIFQNPGNALRRGLTSLGTLFSGKKDAEGDGNKKLFDTAKERRQTRTAPEFGAEKKVSGGNNFSSITKKSQLQIELLDKTGGKARVRANIDDEDVSLMGMQGASTVGVV